MSTYRGGKMANPQVLLVDDDSVIRVTFANSLRKRNYDILEASTGQEAIDMVANCRPQLAIMDFNLPDMTGAETAFSILHDAKVPSIFLSAYVDKEFVSKATKAGALGYLVKPIDVDHALPTIESALERSKEIQKLRDTEDQLHTALEQGRETSIAIGVLMQQCNVTSDQAFQILRTRARNQRRKIASVASELVQAVDNLNMFTTELMQQKTSPSTK